MTSSLLPDPSSQANNEGSGPGLQVRDLSQVQALRDLILCEGGLIPGPFSLWSHPQNFRLKKLKGCDYTDFLRMGLGVDYIITGRQTEAKIFNFQKNVFFPKSSLSHIGKMKKKLSF